MKTTITSHFDNDNMIAYAYRGKYLIAQMDYGTEEFESHDELTKDEEEQAYDLMISDINNYDRNKGYDVRQEQGIYGYGY